MMKVFTVLLMACLLALPSWLSHTVTPVGWGSSIAYEAWVIFNAVIVIGFYCTTRNIFNVWGGLLLTGIYMALFCVYTGITPLQVSLADIGLGMLAGVLTYLAGTAVQVCLLQGDSRESYSVLLAMVAACATAMFF